MSDPSRGTSTLVSTTALDARRLWSCMSRICHYPEFGLRAILPPLKEAFTSHVKEHTQDTRNTHSSAAEVADLLTLCLRRTTPETRYNWAWRRRISGNARVTHSYSNDKLYYEFLVVLFFCDPPIKQKSILKNGARYEAANPLRTRYFCHHFCGARKAYLFKADSRLSARQTNFLYIIYKRV